MIMSPDEKIEKEEEDLTIVDEWFVCDRCHCERDRGELRGCGRRMIKLCSGCIKEIEEDGAE